MFRLMRLLLIAGSVAIAFASGGALAQRPAPAWPELQRFGDRAAFDAYVAEIARIQEIRDKAERDLIVMYHPPTPPPRSLADVRPDVDWGDTAKLMGQFLVVLWDGELTSVDLRPSGAPGLARAGRVELDRTRFGAYARIMTDGRRVVVFADAAGGANFLVFNLGSDGALVQLADFRIAHDNTYDAYIVGGMLVVLSETGLNYLREAYAVPELQQGNRRSRLFNVEDAYRPMIETRNAGIQAISVCDLQHAEQLACDTTATVGPSHPEYWFTADFAYFWYSGRD